MSYRSAFLTFLDSIFRMPEDIQQLMEMTMSLQQATTELDAKVTALQADVQLANDKADLLITALADVRAQLAIATQDPAQAENVITIAIARIDAASAALREQTAQNIGALEPAAPPAEPPVPA